MAYNDISSDQLNSVWQALNAQPPAAFAPPMLPGVSGGGGMLGSSNRFISQIEKMQAAREKAAQQGQAAAALGQIDPLDPDYDLKVRDLATNTSPEIFASPGVQRTLSLSDRQRAATMKAQEQQQKDQQKNLLDQSFKFLQSADENDLTKFVDKYPDAARELAPVLTKRAADLADSRGQLGLLPEHLHKDIVDERGVPIPHKVQAKVKDFNATFEGPLGKVENLQTKRELADMAEKWVKTPEKDREALANEITAALGEKDLVTDSTIQSIAREAKNFRPPPNPDVERFIRAAMGE